MGAIQKEDIKIPSHILKELDNMRPGLKKIIWTKEMDYILTQYSHLTNTQLVKPLQEIAGRKIAPSSITTRKRYLNENKNS